MEKIRKLCLAGEINQIIDTFNSAKPVDDFCVVVDYEDIKAKAFF